MATEVADRGQGIPFAVCQACGTLNEQACEQMDELEADVQRAERAMRKMRQRIEILEGERGRDLRTGPHYEEATKVLLYWQEKCHPKARAPTSDVRLKTVIERMKDGYDGEELRRCVDGYARFPYMLKGRRSAFGYPPDRVVEAELLFRNAYNVDRGLALAAADDIRMIPPQVMARQPWDKVWDLNRRAIVDALRRQFGGGLESVSVEGGIDWPCPQCQKQSPQPEGQETLSLMVRNERGARIAECWVCGLGDARLLAAITGA